MRDLSTKARLTRFIIGACLLVVFWSSSSLHAGAFPRPNLVVLIVAEQFRADYLDLYRPGFSAGGFQRLLSEGAVFPRCRFDHAVTLAAPNAATLATGAYPETHGIVADRWYDAGASKVVSAEDAGPNATPSPGRLIGATLADQLRWATGGRSRVVAISGRPGPAILLAGRRPAGCYWKDSHGRFATALYYRDDLPDWVRVFNTHNDNSRHEGRPWTALDAPPDALPLRVLHLGKPGEHNGYRMLYRSSPFAAEEVLNLARKAIDEEQLGQLGYTDLLIVNLSAPALLALETGAYSPLMRDMVLRLDEMIADFLASLDEAIGLENAAVVFTALHGTPPMPESLRREGLPAGRVDGGLVVKAMNDRLAAEFGSDAFVEKYVRPFVYLSETARQAASAKRRAVIEAAGEAATTGVQGVAGYYAPGVEAVPSALRSRLLRGRHSGRSGDLMLLYEPYFTEDFGQGRGVGSGSPYRYDTDVPLIFLGPAFQTQRFGPVVDASSVAPTLAALLGIAPPGAATGRALTEALRPDSQPETPTLVGPPPPN